MRRASLAGLALSVQLGLPGMMFPLPAIAQEDQIETAIGESRAGATSRELEAQASAQPPRTDDRHELAIFHHKRGTANYRLGNYSRAVEDLRFTLENTQPNRPTPGDWGQRWRIQNDLANAYRARGDWFSEIELWQDAAREYAQSNLYYFHFAQ